MLPSPSKVSGICLAVIGGAVATFVACGSLYAESKSKANIDDVSATGKDNSDDDSIDHDGAESIQPTLGAGVPVGLRRDPMHAKLRKLLKALVVITSFTFAVSGAILVSERKAAIEHFSPSNSSSGGGSGSGGGSIDGNHAVAVKRAWQIALGATIFVGCVAIVGIVNVVLNMAQNADQQKRAHHTLQSKAKRNSPIDDAKETIEALRGRAKAAGRAAIDAEYQQRKEQFEKEANMKFQPSARKVKLKLH